MVANLFDFHYINYRFRSTEDLNCAHIISIEIIIIVIIINLNLFTFYLNLVL